MQRVISFLIVLTILLTSLLPVVVSASGTEGQSKPLSAAVTPLGTQRAPVTTDFHRSACGTKSLTDANGFVALADVSETTGEEENYAVFYRVRFGDYSWVVSLLLSDGTEVAIENISLDWDDENHVVKFSVSAITAFAEENGYTDYQVCFTPVRTDVEDGENVKILLPAPVPME